MLNGRDAPAAERLVLRALFGEYADGDLTRYSHLNCMKLTADLLVFDRSRDRGDWEGRTRPLVVKLVSSHWTVIMEGWSSPVVAKHVHSITSLPTLEAETLPDDVLKALPRRVHPRDPEKPKRPYTLSEFIMYSFDCDGDYAFGWQMWNEAVLPE